MTNLIKDKEISGATYEDAVTLARYDCKHEPNTVGYHDFIDDCMRTGIPAGGAP